MKHLLLPVSAANHARQRGAGKAGYCANMDAYRLMDDMGLDVDEAPVSAKLHTMPNRRYRETNLLSLLSEHAFRE